jgi:hypothetical protein
MITEVWFWDLHLSFTSTEKKEEASSSYMLVITYKATRLHNPHFHRHENLESLILFRNGIICRP